MIAAVRYPIVLVGVVRLRRHPGTRRVLPAVGRRSSAARGCSSRTGKANSSEKAARQIIPQLDEIKAIYGAERLNLIGHSRAPDARIFALTGPRRRR